MSGPASLPVTLARQMFASTSFVGIVNSIAVDAYMEILEILVNEFKLYTTHPVSVRMSFEVCLNV